MLLSGGRQCTLFIPRTGSASLPPLPLSSSYYSSSASLSGSASTPPPCPLVPLRQAAVFILFVTTIFCHSRITHFAARGAFIFLRRLSEENNRTPPRSVNNNRLSLVTRPPLECYCARATRIVVLAASLNRPSIFLFTP
jgi:hypothetical protein